MYENYLIPVINFDPEIIVSGKGSYIFDQNGKKYLDLNSGQFCTVLGHSNRKFNRRLIKQIQTLTHTSTGMISQTVVQLSQKLYEISGAMKGYSILLSTGAEAVEFCIRNAKALTQKNGIVCFDKGYHGLTLGAQSITFSGKYARPVVSDIYPFRTPETFLNEAEIQQSISDFRDLIEQNASKIAAAVFEPIVSVGGMILPSALFFKAAEKICSDNNVLLIFDESQTGFGRMGEWFAYQHLNVIPDMVVAAKGLGNGFPVSAVLMRENLIPGQGLLPVTHYSSHQNDPFTAAVVLAGIDFIEDNDILNRVRKNGPLFFNELKQLCSECGYIQNPRGAGLMFGADLYCEGISNYRKPYAAIHRNMMERGIAIQATNGGKTLRFLPDYLMKKSDFSFALQELCQTLNQLDWKKFHD